MKRIHPVFLLPFALLLFSLAAFADDGTRIERGNLILENVPETPADLAESLRLRRESRGAGFLDWTGNGEQILITTRFGAVPQIHRIASPLGARRQLTFSAEPLYSAVAQPGGDGFVYTKDQGGNEYYQLLVAISDFSSFLKNTAEYRRDLRRAEYGDERNPEMQAFLKRIAPLARANRITAPMFIVHGANDPRVPVTEAEQLLAALKANGAKPWLMIAKDEGHGFQKQANGTRLDEATALFLEQVVLGEPHGSKPLVQ